MFPMCVRAGMLTITDFINILHRYYKSPLVSCASVHPNRCMFLQTRDYVETLFTFHFSIFTL